MKPELLKYTDNALLNLLVSHVKALNPGIVIGERLSGPSALVQGASVVSSNDPKTPITNLVSLDSPPPGLVKKQLPIVAVSAGAVRLNLNDIYAFVQDPELLAPYAEMTEYRKLLTFESPFLYPYAVTIPHRTWLEKYDVGDDITIAVIDGLTFEANNVPTKLTQKMIDDHSYLHFRFALRQEETKHNDHQCSSSS